MLRGLFLAAAIGAVLPGCRSGDAPPARPARIILVSMDTVRADVVHAGTTPVLDEIAAEGVAFDRFYAVAGYTLPTHVSIFTGLDPVEHGVVHRRARLAHEVPAIPQRLRRAGYRTQAFHEGGFVARRFGLGRGFEGYRRVGRREVVRSALPDVLAWMRAQRGSPYFLFLHTYVAHFPYGGYERYRREHPGRGLPGREELLRRVEAVETAEDLPEELTRLCAIYNHFTEVDRLLPCGARRLPHDFPGWEHAAEDLAAMRRSYLRRVGEIDDALGALRETLRELGQWDDTLLVVTSDHGEAFFEHGLAQHGPVPFEEVLRVPLVISYPERLRGRAGSRRIPGLAWHPDLAPTILALAGLAPIGGAGARDLVPAIRGLAPIPPDRTIFPVSTEGNDHASERVLRHAILGRWKRIAAGAAFGGGRDRLFDLAADPEERRDLAREHPDVLARLEAAEARYVASLRPVAPTTWGPRRRPDVGGDPAPIPRELREELHALGYVR